MVGHCYHDNHRVGTYYTLQLMCTPANGVDSSVQRMRTALILEKKKETFNSFFIRKFTEGQLAFAQLPLFESFPNQIILSQSLPGALQLAIREYKIRSPRTTWLLGLQTTVIHGGDLMRDLLRMLVSTCVSWSVHRRKTSDWSTRDHVTLPN